MFMAFVNGFGYQFSFKDILYFTLILEVDLEKWEYNLHLCLIFLYFFYIISNSMMVHSVKTKHARLPIYVFAIMVHVYGCDMISDHGSQYIKNECLSKLQENTSCLQKMLA